MKKADSSSDKSFDYLEKLVEEQIVELLRFGPVVSDILKALSPPTGIQEVETLVRNVLDKQRPLAVVNVDALNMRSEPNQTSPLIKRLRRGTRLFLLEPGSERKIGAQGEWLYCADPEGPPGFVAASYLALEPLPSVDARIGKIMQVIEKLGQNELIKIDRTEKGYYAALTSKGQYVAKVLHD